MRRILLGLCAIGLVALISCRRADVAPITPDSIPPGNGEDDSDRGEFFIMLAFGAGRSLHGVRKLFK